MKRLHLALATLAWAAAAFPCAPAPHSGEDVSIESEEAAILWDSSTKTEHFIRTASFKTQAKDFGFLVPTPTVPELTDVPLWVVSQLLRDTEMRARTEGDDAPGGAPAPGGVEVMKQQVVGNYLATVLKASDPKALTDWLEAHNYAVRPALTKWLGKYTEKGWMITAFQFQGGNGVGIDSTAVRMSFKTDQPFYPYSEPEDQTNSGVRERVLQVVFLSNEKAMGHLGSNPWPGSVEACLDPTRDNVLSALRDLKLPLESADAYMRASRFTDRMLVRSGADDVVFETYAGNEHPGPGSTHEFPTGIAILASSGAICIAVIGIGIVMVRRRRR